jgi:DNA-binding NarL/FixJ family response regulator
MKKLRVLLADDHALVREGLKSVVSAEPDMEVVGEAADGETACHLGVQLKPDIVVMDLGLPKLSGVKATAWLLGTRPTAKVLALSAHDDRGYLQEAIKAGAAGYILKRSAASELIHAIRTVVAGGSYLDPALTREAFSGFARTSGRKGAELDGELTARETEVVRLVAHGYSNREVGAQLDIGIKTVETHRAHAMEKLRLTGRADLVRYAAHRGWLDNL